MMSYMEGWLHLFVIHFGAWLSLMFIMTINKNGIPELKSLKSLFTSAIVLSVLLSIISSHSHNHYLTNIAGVVK